MKTATPISVLLLCGLMLAGCAAFKGIRRDAIPPAAKVTSGTTTVEQTGEARVAASAKAEEKTQTITIPAGSTVWQDVETGQFRYTLGAAVPLRTQTRTESVNAPGAFEPPAPPTIAEEKAAQADYWTTLGYRAGIFIGGAAALFGLVRGWNLVMWGGLAVAGACLTGTFVQNHPTLLLVIGLGAALAFAGPYLWHTKLKKEESPQP